MDEIAEFLRAHPPFDALAPDELERLAGAAETCAFAAARRSSPRARRPRRACGSSCAGGVELVDHGRVLDLARPGRAVRLLVDARRSCRPASPRAPHGETACYRLPGDVTAPAARAARRRCATSRARSSAGRSRASPRAGARPPPSGRSARSCAPPPVRCSRTRRSATVAQRMTEAGQTCAVVELRDGALGILTDRDLRTRVVAAGLSPDAPVERGDERARLHRRRRTASAATCSSRCSTAASATSRCCRPTGALLGRRRRRRPRRRRAPHAVPPAHGDHRARPTPGTLAVVARDLWPDRGRAARRARRAPSTSAAIISVVTDALDRRLIDLAVADAGEPPAPFAWLALGQPRPPRGASRAPTSTARSPGTATTATRQRATTCAASRCGCSTASPRAASRPTRRARPPPTASSPARSTPGARPSTRWFDEPTQEKALILVSIVGDNRPVWGVRRAAPLAEHVRAARRAPGLLRLMARFALSLPPADRLPARHRRRALGRAQGPPRPQARRPAADRRPRPLGRAWRPARRRSRPASACAPRARRAC